MKRPDGDKFAVGNPSALPADCSWTTTASDPPHRMLAPLSSSDVTVYCCSNMARLRQEFFRGLVLSLIAVYIMPFTGWKGEKWYSVRPYRYDEAQR
jgi:hypothetical protein